ncbi:DUF222 domain-containing protein [Nakamurella sp. GG22]
MSEVSVLDAAVAVVGDARQALTELRDTEFWKVPDTDLLLLARDLEALGRLVFTAQVHLAGEVDTRRLAGTHGAASTAALLRNTLGVSHSDAASMVRTAAAVLPQEIPSGGELAPVLPLLADALHEGAIGAEQTRTIVTTMAKLPGRVDDETRLLCQQQLVAHGRITEPAPFAVFARAVLIALDEGQDFDDDPPADHVEFSLGTRNANTGLTRVSGQLDDLGVEIVNQAIGGLSTPVGPDAGVADPRPAATRRGHALLEVLRRYLDLGDAPTQGSERPHITVTMTLDDLRAAPGGDRALGAGGMGLLDFGGPITGAQARTLACDAMIVPAVLGSPSQVLDVGSASRLFPIAIRRALVLRDKGCAFPGCDRPPAWTDAHHVVFWADHGETSYRNGCLLCRHHHSEVHRGNWEIQFADDGIPEFLPPAWIDPARVPRRNTSHHIKGLFGR